jgi:hypothetical protein
MGAKTRTVLSPVGCFSGSVMTGSDGDIETRLGAKFDTMTGRIF